jgi:transposase-like protein
MGRSKGGTNKYWSAKEKYEIIKPIINFEKSSSQVTKETGINNGMISVWVKKYNEEGLNGLENKRKPGNPLSKYSKKKTLNEMEKLQYENMKLKIEVERLKKGYQVKGDGSVVVFKK